MKFEALLETLELREFRGQYFPYAALKKQLYAAIGARRSSLVRKLSSLGPAWNSEGSCRRQGTPEQLTQEALIRQWREAVQTEVARIAEHVDGGLRELRVGLGAVSRLAAAADSGAARGGLNLDTCAPFCEMRSLDAFDYLTEGVGRWRSFAEVNYAALIRLWQTYDTKLETDEGVNIYLPLSAELLGDMDRFDALEFEIKAAVRSSPLLRGLEATPRVARLIAGLGVAHKTAPGNQSFDRSIFALGFFLGICALALLITVVLCHLPARKPETFNTAYFLAPLGVFRLTLSVPLVYWSIGVTTWVCDRKCINYMWLLGIDPRCQVSTGFFFRRAALLTACWMLIFICYILDYKWMLLPRVKAEDGLGVPRGSVHYLTYPVATLVITLCVEVGPSRICRYIYRWGVLRSVGRFVAAPWFVVTFADNLVGDILTSLSRPLQDVAIAFCYLESHHPQTEQDLNRFLHHRSHCNEWEHIWFRPLITGAPLVFRALQCLRRLRDARGETTHFMNFCKYVSAMCVLIIARFQGHQVAVIVVSIWATLFSLWWDVVKDWGLGPFELHRIHRYNRLESKLHQAQLGVRGPDAETAAREALNVVPSFFGRKPEGETPFLNSPNSPGTTMHGSMWRQTSVDLRSSAQQRRLFSASFYAGAVLFDMAARSTWALNYLPITIVSNNLNDQVAFLFFLVVVEIARRALWVILRLEWEQVSNAGGFRALLWVPVRIKETYRENALKRQRQQPSQPSRRSSKASESASIELPQV